jgi:hypothetical protein
LDGFSAFFAKACCCRGSPGSPYLGAQEVERKRPKAQGKDSKSIYESMVAFWRLVVFGANKIKKQEKDTTVLKKSYE